MRKLLLILAFVGLCFSSAEAQKKTQEQPKKKVPYTHRTCNEVASRRTEIILPQVKGFNCYKADFHTHTSYSDGVVSPAGRVDEAWYDGLDIIAITDHLENRSGERKMLKVLAPYNKNGKPRAAIPAGSVKMPKDGKDPGIKADFNAIHKEAESRNESKGYELLLVKGCEMARSKIGHYNALFITNAREVYNKDLKEALRNVQKQGGIAIHNHPGNFSKYETEWHESLRKEGLIQGYEVANGYTYYPAIHNRCIDEKLTMFGNTDTHGVTAHRYATNGLFRTMTIVLAKECTEKAIKDALLKHRTIVYSGGDLIGDEEWLEAFLNAAVDCQVTKVDNEAGKRTFYLTNNSSITLRLRRGKTIYVLEPFKATTISFGKDKKSGKFVKPNFYVDNMWVKDYKHPKFTLELDK